MEKMTSAAASKLIKTIEEENRYYHDIEDSRATYTAGEGEKPVIPDYNYREVCNKLMENSLKIEKIKHALNVANSKNLIEVDGEKITIDVALIRMSFLNRRKYSYSSMRIAETVRRLSSQVKIKNVSVPEYSYLNYDPKEAGKDYDETLKKIQNIQLALDLYNQTVLIEVDI